MAETISLIKDREAIGGAAVCWQYDRVDVADWAYGLPYHGGSPMIQTRLINRCLIVL